MKKENKIFYEMCEYLCLVYPELNADEIREAAESGITMADDMAKDLIKENTPPRMEDRCE